MNCDELQQRTAAHALGALDAAEAAELKRRLAEDPAARAEFARFRDVAAAVAGATAPPRQPPAALRSRILERIRSTPQTAAPAEPIPPPPALPAGFRVVEGNTPWIDSAFPGIQIRVLAVNPQEGYRMLQVKVAPGCGFPHHIHRQGAEQIFVLSGDLVTAGRILQAGDFMHAEAGSDHQEIRSPSGCVALLVEPVEGPEVVMA